ncbi:MAG: hypothetical protein LPK06_03145, partial [Marinobacter sp.]|nr:hypothetical protein [Marinobacter sp.]
TDWLIGWRTDKSLAKRYAQPRDGRLRPAFVPLHTAGEAEQRFGTPVLTLRADQEAPVLAALAVRREGSARPRPVNDQMTVVRPGQTLSLPPMAVELAPGDQLGLLLFSRHPQFNTLPLTFGDGVTFSGVVRLPATLQALAERGDPAVLKSQTVVSDY